MKFAKSRHFTEKFIGVLNLLFKYISKLSARFIILIVHEKCFNKSYLNSLNEFNKELKAFELILMCDFILP